MEPNHNGNRKRQSVERANLNFPYFEFQSPFHPILIPASQSSTLHMQNGFQTPFFDLMMPHCLPINTRQFYHEFGILIIHNTRSIAPIPIHLYLKSSSPNLQLVRFYLGKYADRAAEVSIWGLDSFLGQDMARKVHFIYRLWATLAGLCQPIHLNGCVMILSNDQLWDVVFILLSLSPESEWVQVFALVRIYTTSDSWTLLDMIFLYTAMIEFEFIISQVLRF
jgi:hypothetical protein